MPRTSEGNWPKAVIGGLVLLNLVLITMLVLRQPARAGTAEPAAPSTAAARSAQPTPTSTGGSPTATPAGDPTPSGSSSASPTATGSTPKPVRSTRMLAVSSDTLAWRSVYTACPDESTVEVSRDGGRTWRSTKSGLRSVSRLRAYGESSVFAVGATADCEARYVATGGPGESWATNERLLGRTWYRSSQKPARVHAPDGRETSPCKDGLRDFAGLGDQGAAALCSDGSLRTTQDSGRTWREVDGVDDGLAIGADEQVYALAMRREGCDGVAIALLTPGAQKIDKDAVRCASVGSADSGNVAVGVRDQTLWLWLDDEVNVSTDRGRSWD